MTRTRSRTLSRFPLLGAGLAAAPLLLACSAPPSAPVSSASAPAANIEARVAHRDPQLGVPTFVWLDAQPAPGAPIGDAATVRLVLPGGTYAYRLVFLLHL